MTEFIFMVRVLPPSTVSQIFLIEETLAKSLFRGRSISIDIIFQSNPYQIPHAKDVAHSSLYAAIPLSRVPNNLSGTRSNSKRRWEARLDSQMAPTCFFCSIASSLTASLPIWRKLLPPLITFQKGLVNTCSRYLVN